MQNSELRKDLQDILDALKNIASKSFNAVSTPNTSQPSADEFEAAILCSLTAEPLTITELVSAISLQSAGRFNPSTGKTHELLGKLAENKLVSKKVESERRLFAITDKGKRRLAGDFLDAGAETALTEMKRIPTAWASSRAWSDKVSSAGGRVRRPRKPARSTTPCKPPRRLATPRNQGCV